MTVFNRAPSSCRLVCPAMEMLGRFKCCWASFIKTSSLGAPLKTIWTLAGTACRAMPKFCGAQFLSGQVVRTVTIRMGRLVSMLRSCQNLAAKPSRLAGRFMVSPGVKSDKSKPRGMRALK